MLHIIKQDLYEIIDDNEVLKRLFLWWIVEDEPHSLRKEAAPGWWYSNRFFCISAINHNFANSRLHFIFA